MGTWWVDQALGNELSVPQKMALHSSLRNPGRLGALQVLGRNVLTETDSLKPSLQHSFCWLLLFTVKL